MQDEILAQLKALCMNQTKLLPGNRTIGYSEIGDPNGRPVVFFYGLGGNRFMTQALDAAARQKTLRLITIDRPGRGKTTAVAPEDLSLITFAAAVIELLDEVSIAKFSLMAHSCGALFAAALAISAPDRVCGKVALITPWCVPSSCAVSGSAKVGCYIPGAVVSFFGSFFPYMAQEACKNKMEGFCGSKMKTSFSASELAYVTTPNNLEVLKQTMVIVMEEGGKQAMINDILMCMESRRKCDVRYEDVTVPVIIYHGDADKLVPLKTAQTLQASMQDCQLIIRHGGSHNIVVDYEFMEDVVFTNFNAEWKAAAGGAPT